MSQTNDIPVKNRIAWIDNLRAIGIIFVVLGHIITLVKAPAIYNKYIYSFHLPLFLFISGYLFDLERYRNFQFFLKKRFKTLIMPYFIFAFLSLIVVFLLQYLQYYNISDFGNDFTGINSLIHSATKILYSYDLGAYNGPIWFLTFLFVVEIYFYFLRKYIKNTRTLIFILLMSSLAGYLYSLYISFKLPWHLEVALIGVVFYGIANIYKKQINHFLDKLLNKRYLVPVFLLVFLSINIMFAYLNDSLGMYINKYGNYFFFFIASFSGIFFYLLISKKISNLKILSFIGKNTLIILVIHAFFSDVILLTIHNYLNDNIFNYTVTPIYLAIVYTFLLIIIMVPSIILINKYFPFLIGKNKRTST